MLRPALRAEHAVLLSLIDEIRGEIRGGLPDSSLPGTQAVLRRFAGRMARLFDVEDRLLFPSFEEQVGMRDAGPTLLLRRDHREMERRVGELRTTPNLEGADDKLYALRALIEDHWRREEVVLSICDRALDPEQRKAALEALGERSDTETSGRPDHD